MSLKARQFALVQNTATNLFPTGTFPNQPGSNQDRASVSLKNEDSAATIWIGGSDVSNTNGQSLSPGQQMPFALYKNDVPYGYTTASTTPIVSVMAGGQ